MGRQNQNTDESKQHFSHPHVLKPVNPAEVETLTCNACEKPSNSNKPFYGCNSCQYFLHENCSNAPRFLNHSSHPSHPLTLLPIPTYSSRSYTCNACGSAGNIGSCFSCACCEFDIHLQCASCPSSLLVDKHPHQLGLLFGSPYQDKNTEYVCDICNVIMNRESWLYYCAGCDFASHLQCAISPEVGVFPRQQRPSPSPHPNPNPNPTVETINSVNEAHEQILAAQLRAQIEARGREAALDIFRTPRRYSYI
ncbi:protein VACUOLELESS GAMETOPHYTES-like [Nicotiana tomentosiformis]|uniref:protein VACUOLELESS GAMETOPHYTES-like n=1 Tax=Nicotiana tomentosiformis TaxID=4098 RepID=UPI00051AB8A7